MSIKKILIVDDEPDILKTMKFRLKKEGFDVTTAEKGEDALKAVSAHRPDLVLLDVMLPDINGFDICTKIKSEFPSIKVIIFTGKVEAVDATKARIAGADRFTAKTQNFSSIIESIRGL